MTRVIEPATREASTTTRRRARVNPLRINYPSGVNAGGGMAGVSVGS